MNCIKQIMPHVNTLLIPPLFPTHVMKSNKRQVRFSKKDDVHILTHPRPSKMKR